MSKRFAIPRFALAAALACGALLLPQRAPAPPVVDDIVNGNVTIHQDGSVTVIQASDGAIIHYDSFDIFAGEVVQFLQPSEHARVLNRVFGDATTIEGTLLANGIVYIVNPAGVFFRGDAVVEVGGLVAAAGHITNEDFLKGVDRFELTGAVVNESGTLQGDVLALLGQRVENHGNLQAPDGTIALVAGERVVLARLGGRVAVEVDGPAEPVQTVGIQQTGLVDAGRGQVIFAVGDHYSLAMNHEGVTRGGDVELRGGDDGVLVVRGEIDASGDADSSGGEIRVLGDRIALLGARLDASGGTGGGSIRVGGDLRGGGELPVARRTYVDSDSVLSADATQTGDGGDVVVWGDEAAVMSGRISARGAGVGGDGGFAEISSLGMLEADGEVDLGAAAGEAGTLLFDPQDIVIVGGTADGSDDPDGAPPEDQVVGDDGTLGRVLFGHMGDDSEPFEIYESEIEGTDANVVLEARNSITSGGVFDDDTITIVDGNSLTLTTINALNDDSGSLTTPGIDLTDIDLVTSGGGTITLETGAAGAADGAEAAIVVGNLSTSGDGGSVTLTTDNGAISVGTVDTSGADGATGTSAGDITFRAGDADGSGDTRIDVAGDLLARGGDGTDGDGGAGGGIDARTFEQMDSDPQAGGGAVMILGEVDSSGGDGVGTDASGGDAGLLILVSAVQGAVDVGDLSAVGGDADATGSGNGGDGGFLAAVAEDGDVTTGAADSSGGDGGMDVDTPGFGGAGGDLTLQAGFSDEASGALTMMGALRSVDGATLDTPGGGGEVNLRARDDLEFVGVAGPEITTGGALTLVGRSVGEANQIEVDAGGTVDEVLTIEVADTADVNITNAGFRLMDLTGSSNQATLDVTQAAEKVGGNGVTVDIDGSATTSTVVQIDTTQIDDAVNDNDTVGTEVQVAYTLEDDLFDADDLAEDLVLTVASDAITAASVINLNSEDDVVLENGAIQMFEVLDPDDFSSMMPVGAGTGASAGLQIVADFDSAFPDPTDPMDMNGDGTGAILGQGGVAIDMNADDAAESGLVALVAGAGVGAPGAEIVTQNLGGLGAAVSMSGGVHVRNASGSGDVTLMVAALAPNGVVVADGDGDGVIGDVEIVNDAGNLVVGVDVSATGEGITSGGDIDFGASGEIHLADASGITTVEGAGNVSFAGPVVLDFDSHVVAGGDVSFSDTIDSDAANQVFRGLRVDSGDTVSFGGDLGSGLALSRLAVSGDTVLDEDRSIEVLDSVSFEAIDASSADAAMLSIVAGDGTIFDGRVTFSGNIGENARLSGLTVDTSSITFDADGDQSVETGAGGILLDRDLATVPIVANVGKVGGDLLLDTTGAIELGENQKLTVAGVADLFGDTRVTVGDVNATAINIETALFEVRARPAASFLLPGSGVVPDFSTELFANTISTDSAATVIGTGPTPRFATLSGSVDGAGAGGAIGTRLGKPIAAADLVDVSNPSAPVFYDLGLSLSDPGNETEPDPEPLAEQLPALPGEQAAAGSAVPPRSDAVQAFLDCAESQDAARACAPGASPLDSARGDEIARRHARLFGSSVEARASRDMLRGPQRSERDAVLRDFATLLAQLQLLGLETADYEQVRDQLLDQARGDTPRDALLADLRTQARGIPL